jgi:Eukaryotic protein of unknown function (DUF866)
MVTYTVSMKANQKGVVSLKFVNPDSSICLDVRHPVDQGEVREKIVIDTSEFEAVHWQKQEDNKKHHHDKPHHFALKWSDGSRGSILVKQLQPQKNLGLELPKSGEFVPVLTLQCEHVEPVAFYPLGTEFEVVDSAGVTHASVDLSKDWNFYDLSSGSAAVTGFQSKIV